MKKLNSAPESYFLTTYTQWSRKNCTKFNDASFCSRLQWNYTVFTRMFRN